MQNAREDGSDCGPIVYHSSHRPDVHRCFFSQLQWECKLNAGWGEEESLAISRDSRYTYIEAADWCKSSRCVSTADEGEGRKLNPTWHCEPLASPWGRKQLFYLHNLLWSYDCVGRLCFLLMLAKTHFKPVSVASKFMYCRVQKTSSRCHIVMHALTHCCKGCKWAILGVFLLSSPKKYT